MSNPATPTGERRLKFVLPLVVALEALVYLGAALLHSGIRIPLGLVVLAVPHAIPAATIVETLLGVAAMRNVVALIRAWRSSMRITFRIHLILLAGVSLGMVALARFQGPPPSPDWTIHYVMLLGIATVMILLLIRRVRRSNGTIDE